MKCPGKRRSASGRTQRWFVVAAAMIGGCIRHTEIDYVGRVREMVAAQVGKYADEIENGTRLEELGFDESALTELVARINEGTSLKITAADLKGLPAASKSWKRLRVHDIGCFVGSKILDLRDANRRVQKSKT